MKRKTCASVLALVLTCAMVTGSLPVEATAAEAAAASELTAVQDESQEQAEVTDETKGAGDETAGDQEQVTEPVQGEEKQEEQTTEPAQDEEKQEEQVTEPAQDEKKQEEQTTETADDQAASDDQAAPIAAEAADSVKYLGSTPVSFYETLYWNGKEDEPRDPLRMEQRGEDEYNLYLYENQWIAPSVIVNLAEGAPEDTVVTASWYQLHTDEQDSKKLYTDSPQMIPGAMKIVDGTVKTSDITVTAASASTGKSQEVTIHIMPIPCLEGLSITCESGETVAVDNDTNNLFSRDYKDLWNNMTATVSSEKVVLTATQNSQVTDQTYEILYNEAAANEFLLNEGENPITITVKNKAGVTNTYKITITREAEQGVTNVTFVTDPADALIMVTDSYNDRVWPVSDHIWKLQTGGYYTWTATKKGYIGQQNSFQVTSNTVSINLTKASANGKIDTSITAEWGNFRKGDDELGITDAKTPYNPDDAELLWAVQYGRGWQDPESSPVIVDGDLVIVSGTNIYRLDKNTGTVKAKGTMTTAPGYATVPVTYGGGMIFAPLNDGKIQAFDAKTLESLWIYTDKLGGQPITPITYKDGYIYEGFWNGETKNANFACISVTDEVPTKTNETKYASWTYKRMGGFYWAGAYVTDKFAIVGTDDGDSGCTAESASLLVFNRETGEVVDSWDDIRGDIRSNISHDPKSDRVFFTSKGGVLCNAKIDWETGEITDKKSVVIVDANGNKNASSTSTPSVYNGRIYIGISGPGGLTGGGGHAVGVYDLKEDGSMEQAYTYATKGYPQTSAMVTTAYSAEDESVYIYLPYNALPGGVVALKDKKGQTAPQTITDSDSSEIFTPAGALSQYCIGSVIADQYGTLYYKNDSCYIMAITSKIESIEVTKEPGSIAESDGTITAEGLKVVSNLKNGEQRDITDYVKLSKKADGTYLVTYTYGFDNANYGLKTLTTTFGKPDFIYGDVTGDGEVRTADAALTYAYVNGAYEFTEEQKKAADVTGDGDVRTIDAALIYAYVNGILEEFPAEQ